MRLGVDDGLKDPDYEYRWINDDRGRLEAKTQQDDWDIVTDPNIVVDEKNNSIDTRVRRVVGVTSGGQPMYAYFCRKRKEFCDEDRRAKYEARVARRQQMIRSQDSGASGGIVDDPKHMYVPAEAQSAIATSPELRRIRRA